jgi:photosystem II stability/assembly factor-like uncharacterized protein
MINAFNMKTTSLSFFLLFIAISLNAQQWQNITPADYPYVMDYSFINSKQGWVGAYKALQSGQTEYLLYTNNGAQDFEERYVFQPGVGRFTSFQMIDSLVGYGMADKYNHFFWRTLDGGYTWADITDTTIMFYAGNINKGAPIFFLNRDTGFIGGVSSFYKTTDGCQSWVKCNTPQYIDTTITYNNSFYATKLYFNDKNNGWATCNWMPDSGFGMKTTDGGLNWSVCTSALFPYMCDVQSADSLKVGMVGENRVALSENNFESYSHLYDAGDVGISTYTIAYQNDSIIWLGGSPGTIVRSVNRGETFTDFMPAELPLLNTWIKQIRFYDNVGYAMGEHNGNEIRFLLKFVDTINTNVPAIGLMDNSLHITPNPVTNTCTVTVSLPTPTLASIELYSAAGLMVQSMEKLLNTGENSIEFDVHTLASGIYFVVINTLNKQFTAKFIKR